VGLEDRILKSALKFGKKSAKFVADTTKATGKEAVDALHTVQKPLDYIADKAADGTVKGAKLTGKLLTKKTDPSLMNFYTGRDLSAFSKVAMPVAGAAVGYGMFVKNTAFAPKPGTVSYGSEAPVFAADGVSNTTNAPTLNATGNMVFGLHNARKG
jgi:hypothetical protein